MREGVLITNDVPGRPPRANVRVLSVRDGDGTEAAPRARLDIQLELVQALEIPHDAPLRPIDLEAVVVLSPGREARPFIVADSAAGELDQCLGRVVDIDLAAPSAAIRQRTLADECPE